MRDHPTIDHLPKDERIRAIAYALWEEEGCPEGRAEAHWLRAEALVEAVVLPDAEPEWLRRELPAETVVPEEPVSAIEDIVRRMAAGRAA